MTSSPSQLKKQLREQMRQCRRALPEHVRLEAQARILQHVVDSGISTTYKSVAGYIHKGSEVDILPIMDIMASCGGALALPCIEDDNRMVFRRWHRDEALSPGKFGIACASGEVIIPELLLMPLLAFDAHGARLGAGGGYYDRTLAEATYAHCYRLGVAFTCQRVKHLPAEPHDARLHAVVTEDGIEEFLHL